MNDSKKAGSDGARAIAENSIVVRLWPVDHELPDSGETVVFDESQSELVLLNPMGGAVWSLIDGRRSVHDIVTILVEEIEGNPGREEVTRVAVEFLESMSKRGALGLASSSS